MTDRFRIAATGHSLNYLPEYVATHRGYFADEGLDVSVVVPKPWDLVLDELRGGTSEAALGGIWVPSMYLGRADRFTPFAQMSNKAPLALLGRGDPATFSFDDLRGRTVAMKGSNGASVGMYLKMVLRENGVDTREVRFIQDLDGAMLSELFVGGMADYLLIDYPNADKVALASNTRVQWAFASEEQVIPWSVYYSIGEPSEAKRALQTRFTRALGRGMLDVVTLPAESYRDVLEVEFPAFEIERIIALCDEYRSWNMWTTPEIDRSGYARWQTGIALAGLTDAPLAYMQLVDSIPFDRAFPLGTAHDESVSAQ